MKLIYVNRRKLMLGGGALFLSSTLSKSLFAEDRRLTEALGFLSQNLYKNNLPSMNNIEVFEMAKEIQSMSISLESDQFGLSIHIKNEWTSINSSSVSHVARCPMCAEAARRLEANVASLTPVSTQLPTRYRIQGTEYETRDWGVLYEIFPDGSRGNTATGHIWYNGSEYKGRSYSSGVDFTATPVFGS